MTKIKAHQHLSSIYFFDQISTHPKWTDLVIICNGNIIINAHRLVLMAHSEYIRVILEKEDPSELAAISLPDFSQETVKIVLGYLYNGGALLRTNQIPEVVQLLEILDIKLGPLMPKQKGDEIFSEKIKTTTGSITSIRPAAINDSNIIQQTDLNYQPYNNDLISPDDIDIEYENPNMNMSFRNTPSNSSPPMRMPIPNPIIINTMSNFVQDNSDLNTGKRTLRKKNSTKKISPSLNPKDKVQQQQQVAHSSRSVRNIFNERSVVPNFPSTSRTNDNNHTATNDIIGFDQNLLQFKKVPPKIPARATRVKREAFHSGIKAPNIDDDDEEDSAEEFKVKRGTRKRAANSPKFDEIDDESPRVRTRQRKTTREQNSNNNNNEDNVNSNISNKGKRTRATSKEKVGRNKIVEENKCFLCDKNFISEEALTRHIEAYCGSHLKEFYEFVDDDKKCKICNFVFSNQPLNEFMEHMTKCYRNKNIEETRSPTASNNITNGRHNFSNNDDDDNENKGEDYDSTESDCLELNVGLMDVTVKKMKEEDFKKYKEKLKNLETETEIKKKDQNQASQLGVKMKPGPLSFKKMAYSKEKLSLICPICNKLYDICSKAQNCIDMHKKWRCLICLQTLNKSTKVIQSHIIDNHTVQGTTLVRCHYCDLDMQWSKINTHVKNHLNCYKSNETAPEFIKVKTETVTENENDIKIDPEDSAANKNNSNSNDEGNKTTFSVETNPLTVSKAAILLQQAAVINKNNPNNLGINTNGQSQSSIDVVDNLLAKLEVPVPPSSAPDNMTIAATKDKDNAPTPTAPTISNEPPPPPPTLQIDNENDENIQAQARLLYGTFKVKNETYRIYKRPESIPPHPRPRSLVSSTGTVNEGANASGNIVNKTEPIQIDLASEEKDD